jgi:hypothetical protein
MASRAEVQLPRVMGGPFAEILREIVQIDYHGMAGVSRRAAESGLGLGISDGYNPLPG